MGKTLIHKGDVKNLDLLIEACLGANMASIDILPDIGNDPFSKSILPAKVNHYQRLFDIIEEYGVAEVQVSSKNEPFLNEIPIVTKRFHKKGGFAKVYQEQQHHLNLQKVREEKEINDAKISKWHKKTYWWTFCLAILGFVLAFISLYLQFC